MSKIYGYRESDIKRLYGFIKENKKETLSKAFALYGEKFKKSKGTVRNLYYAMAKKSREDESFRNEFLDGEILTVKKNEKFDDAEKEKLLSGINFFKAQGVSVRKAVYSLAGGDVKLALRFQNKYRNALKVKKENEARGAAALLKKIYGVNFGVLSERIPDEYLTGLKREINGLCDRLFKSLKRENEELKARLAAFERGASGASAGNSADGFSAAEYFNFNADGDAVN